MQPGEVTVDVTLPHGVAGRRGRRDRRARLRALDGHGELIDAREANPHRAALTVLATSAVQVGPHENEEVNDDLLAGLAPIDRDFLLLHLHRISFGAAIFQTIRCPSEACGKLVDVRLDLSTVGVPQPKARRRGARNRLAAMPQLDTALRLRCIECRASFPWVYSPAEVLVSTIRAGRTAVLREVHSLAFHYHWSHAEILSLPRTLRHDYVSVLDQELGRAGAKDPASTREERVACHG